jgi:hypothetical protein
MTKNKLGFDILCDIFLSEFRPRQHLPTPPLPLSFTAITDHPRAGEVPPGCGLHSGAAPVNIPVSFHSRAAQRAGVAGSQSDTLSCSKFTDVAAPFWPDFRNRSTLLHTCQISEEVSLHLMKVRSKLNGLQYWTDLLDPNKPPLLLEEKR